MYLTLSQVADMIGYSGLDEKWKVRKMRAIIQEKQVPHQRIGRDIFLTPEQLDELNELLKCSSSSKSKARKTGTSAAPSKGSPSIRLRARLMKK